MNYIAITKDEMLQGEGLRVALWVSGCEIHCNDCHNYEYWDKYLGTNFNEEAYIEICQELNKPYIAGLSILGGNPTESYNIEDVTNLCKRIKENYPEKNIWLYSGHTWEFLKDFELMKYIDILVDGEFVEELADVNYKWAGSTNQRVINVQESLKLNKIVLEG